MGQKMPSRSTSPATRKITLRGAAILAAAGIATSSLFAWMSQDPVTAFATVGAIAFIALALGVVVGVGCAFTQAARTVRSARRDISPRAARMIVDLAAYDAEVRGRGRRDGAA